jgi:DNA-binding transcriptional regulator YdaS (Cro superfamily)
MPEVTVRIKPQERGTPEVVELAIELAGGFNTCAEKLELKTTWSLRKWVANGVPAERVRALSAATDHRVKPVDLRPDLFDLEQAELP